jgi:hypothetical protein
LEVLFISFSPGLWSSGPANFMAWVRVLSFLVWLACTCHTNIISLIGSPIAKKSPIAGVGVSYEANSLGI